MIRETPENMVRRLTLEMHRQNSEAALQAAIELMLTDRPSTEVIQHLRAWASYLENRI